MPPLHVTRYTSTNSFPARTHDRHDRWQRRPVARAAALLLAAGAAGVAAGAAQAQAFSPAWFASKGASISMQAGTADAGLVATRLDTSVLRIGNGAGITHG